MKKALLFATSLILLSSCRNDDPVVPEDFQRSVLVYIAGDNNLTSYLRADMRQIIQGTQNLDTNNKLILFVDNTRERPYFLQVEKGDTTRLKTFETELKSSNPETLYDAMKYVIDNFKAKSYGLVLWGHADGWLKRNATSPSTNKAPRKAYGVDNRDGQTYMNIPDMAKALQRLPKLKFIFADCCCFMCVESVYELRKCADYIIGSAAEIPAEGAPYQTVVPAMFSQDSTFYSQIVEKYYEQKSGNYNVPLVAVKTSELDDLASTTAATLQSFANDIEPDDDGCRYPNTDYLIFYFDHTQYDMQDFMLHYANEEQYLEWKRVFDRAVPVRTYAEVWMANHIQYNSRYGSAFAEFTPTEEREGGLGMFVPQRDSDARWWSVAYRQNLGLSMQYLNSTIKNMQWYQAAQLDKMGW